VPGPVRRRELLVGAAAAGVLGGEPLDAIARRVRARNPADLGLLEAAALLHTRRLSAVELLRACQARIDTRNGGPPSFDGAANAVNAWVRLYPDVALREARAADRRLARQRKHAPLLCGIPLGLKDLFAVHGLPLTASSRVLEGNVPRGDSTVWRRLHAAGMVLVGHTHTHEFALGPSTDQVGNPWRLASSAGGSSGGSAAALAARMVPAAVGSDTGGSLRLPAALCGVSTIKPTRGRVPGTGEIPTAYTLDHPGPMARSVADCAVLLQAMAAGGGEFSAQAPPSGALRELATHPRRGHRPLAGIRIAITDRISLPSIDPDVADGVIRARRALERLGARIVSERSPSAATLTDAGYSTIFQAEVWAYHRQFAARASLYRPSTRELIARLSGPVAAADYVAAQQERDRVAGAWMAWFRRTGADLVLEPTALSPAPARGVEEAFGKFVQLGPLWDATGFPVVSLPAGIGRRSGLPVSASLVAPRGGEGVAVRVAVDLQERELEPPRLRAIRS
jgi:aspartyl-tRNA(Asn)/glutamyl-tRNA(Gln) amidotransferase subunit A